MRKYGWEVREFDSGMMSWHYRMWMKPVQRLITNFKKDLDLFAHNPFSLHPYREEKLRLAIREFRPHILFVIRGHGFSPAFLQEVREKYKIQKVVGWWTKGSKWYELAETEARGYDLFFFMNRDFVIRLRQAGHPQCYYLPHAANTEQYYPLDNVEKTLPVLFVGTWSKRRQHFMEALLPYAPIIYGPKWRQSNLLNFSLLRCLRGRYLSPSQVNERYNRSKVVLNLNVLEVPPHLEGGFNQRIYDVPASGSFLLTEKAKGLEEIFVIGEEVEAFGDAAELQDKAAFYLKNDSAREKIARKGYEKVQRVWTWDQRVQEMIRYLGVESPSR